VSLSLRAIVCTGIAAIAFASPARAQARAMATPALDAIDSLITRGQADSARTALDQWLGANSIGPEADGATRAHALFLRGVLSRDWSDAQDAFLAVALAHPTSPHAPFALLRLSQGLFAFAHTGDATAAARATGYLERLSNDYPGTPIRAQALLWLAYAHEANRRTSDACTAAAGAIRAVGDDETASLARDVRRRTCTGDSDDRLSLPTQIFAVQLGAFRTRESADQLAARSRSAGFNARVVSLEGGSLFRVRAGSFPTQGDAELFADRLRNAGFETAIVNDVRSETTVR
jgi:hypothetical protein